jgi:hypothetical protein
MTRHNLAALLGVIGLTLAASCAVLEESNGSNDKDDSGSGGSIDGTGGTGIDFGNGGAGDKAAGGATSTPGTGGKSPIEEPKPLPACETLKGLESCSAQSVAAQKKVVNLMLVMDKSGSMTGTPEGYTTTLWSGLKQAIGASLTEVKDELNVGLVLYPERSVPTDCKGADCCAIQSDAAPDVAIGKGEDTVPKIVETLNGTQPGGGTPIAKGLERALQYYVYGEGATLPGEKIVLLATDGGPNCNADLPMCEDDRCTTFIEKGDECVSPRGCLDDAAVVDAIKKLRTAGVVTLVVGIPGSEAYGDVLNKFADAGMPGKSYYSVSASGGTNELTKTFTNVATQLVRSCDIKLPSAPPTNEINVAVDCSIIEKEQEDGSGWDLVDKTTIRLKGPVCERIKTIGVQRLDTVVGCETIG